MAGRPKGRSILTLTHSIRTACCITLCPSLSSRFLLLSSISVPTNAQGSKRCFPEKERKNPQWRGKIRRIQSRANMGRPCRVHLSSALIFSCLTFCSSSSSTSNGSATTSKAPSPEESGFPPPEEWFNGTSRSPHLSASTFFRRGGGINVDDHASRGRERLRWHDKEARRVDGEEEEAAPTSTTMGPDQNSEDRR